MNKETPCSNNDALYISVVLTMRSKQFIEEVLKPIALDLT